MNQSASDQQIAKRIGEVVESATHRFTAQCYRLYEAPPLGAFVRTREVLGTEVRGMSTQPPVLSPHPSIYGVVCSITTESLDPGRPVIARGQEEETEEDIYRSNPQLSRLLCTRFQTLIVGYAEGAIIKHYLPPQPPRIHALVYSCTSDEILYFTQSLDFLHLLVNSGVAATDEVVAACLRQASLHHLDGQQLLVQGGKVLAMELNRELPRLNAILRRLKA